MAEVAQRHAEDMCVHVEEALLPTDGSTAASTTIVHDVSPDAAKLLEQKKINKKRHADNGFLIFLNKIKGVFEQIIRSDTIPFPEVRTPRLTSFDLQGVADLIARGAATKIIVMLGPAVSEAAGVPDFLSPSCSIYEKIRKTKKPHPPKRPRGQPLRPSEESLPSPEAVFSLSQFEKNPKASYATMKGILSHVPHPTRAHLFTSLLAKKGLLLRVYTQNVDGLEMASGLPQDLVVQAHGGLTGTHCVKCQGPGTMPTFLTALREDKLRECGGCGGVHKPNIVFFEEDLPDRFYQAQAQDFPQCDLLILIGTPLNLQPFASLPYAVSLDCPRLLIHNMDISSGPPPAPNLVSHESGPIAYHDDFNWRDVGAIGDIEEKVTELVDHLGWAPELEELEAKLGPSPLLEKEGFGAIAPPAYSEHAQSEEEVAHISSICDEALPELPAEAALE